MPVTTNYMLDVKSYKVNFNFVQSTIGSSDRLAVITLFDGDENILAEMHFLPNYTSFSVNEYNDEVDILMSTDHFENVYQVLRSEKPLYITFFRDDNGVLNNVWFGTSSYEPPGEEERKVTCVIGRLGKWGVLPSPIAGGG
ncbi:MAG TPA: hypothetical protein PLI09_15130 [Candidatus Hydrogenedentes bacterium]|nr:hypothetical protein [Candidatus Hydrogenedentota bacterium]